jgi:hypothetical protein
VDTLQILKPYVIYPKTLGLGRSKMGLLRGTGLFSRVVRFVVQQPGPLLFVVLADIQKSDK